MRQRPSFSLVLNDFLILSDDFQERSDGSKAAYYLLVIYQASNNHYVLILYSFDATSVGHPREL